MQIAHTLEALHLKRPSVVTIGAFDGVHLGHQALIEALVKKAQQEDQAAIVVSFFPHPDVVLRQIQERYYLTSPDEKAWLMQQMGVDALVLHPFDTALQQMRAATFVDRLRQFLNMQSLLITPEFAMGYQREGNLHFLTMQGAEKGFQVLPFDLITAEGRRISSTEIRQHLLAGEVEMAGAMLGRPYAISGEVVHGEKRGRQIGFPTANIAAWAQQVLPANGVYACRITLDEGRYNAVTNIGQRPTFAGQGITVEAHVLDFEGDLYGQMVRLEFVRHLRGEQKFAGIDALIAQIGRDRDAAREILSDLTDSV